MFRILAFLGLPAVLIMAIVTHCLGRAPRHRRLVPVLWVIGMEAALLGGAYREVTRLHYPRIDYGPDVSPKELVGDWNSRIGTLSLRADGTFQRNTGEHGQWSAEGSRSAHIRIGDREWCVLRVDGQLQLLRQEDCQADGDNWYYSRAFSRIRP